tara:strand:+ start:23358 stop:23594 length:237 start_codon:yes stop_codon:yes gene_type:complete
MELTKYYLSEIYPSCTHIYFIRDSRVYLLDPSIDGVLAKAILSAGYKYKLDKFKLKYHTHSFEASSHKEAIKITKLLT